MDTSKLVDKRIVPFTEKKTRGEVSFDSLNVKYASKLSCYASPKEYLSHLISKMTNTLFDFLSDKYASGEASLDNFEAYWSFCRSNDTLLRAHFYGAKAYMHPIIISFAERETVE
jgi:hypothetical protein